MLCNTFLQSLIDSLKEEYTQIEECERKMKDLLVNKTIKEVLDSKKRFLCWKGSWWMDAKNICLCMSPFV